MKLKKQKVLVLGATGYVGGRLVSRLVESNLSVRATGRFLEKLKSRVWADSPRIELQEADVYDRKSLSDALQGVDVVYYLVHSMNPQNKDFEASDRLAAQNMIELSAQHHVKRIIYLGGLGDDEDKLSKHLRSRREVEEILHSGSVPVTILRAAMIIGSGSASFEILRYLVERLPVMVTPRWVNTPNQPIAIRNVIEYLYGCIEHPETAGNTYDIGGKDVISYLQLMRIYAQEAGLPKRFVIPVPVLTPKLSSLWIHLVTPVPSYIAMPLAEGLKNPVVCRENKIQEIIPQELLDCRESIRRALMLTNLNQVKTNWTDAGVVPEYAAVHKGDPSWAGGTILQDKRVRTVKASKEMIWSVISRIGGGTGWYHGTWLWVLRGFIDRLVGGVGSSRGRRDSVHISVGDALDFWRVADVKDNKRLLLTAEMKLPGVASLDFCINEKDKTHCELIQHARFQPHGLAGLLYWYAVFPLHEYIFGGMIRKISNLAEAEQD